MKQFRFIFIAFFVFFSVFEKTQAKVNYGVKLGLNFSTETSVPFIFDAPSLDISTQHGTEACVFMEGQINSSRWFYDAGISFSRKGSKYEANVANNTSAKETGYNRVDYLQLPISLKYKIPMDEHVKFYATTGLFLGLAMTGNIEVKPDDGLSTYHLKEKIVFGNSKDALLKKQDCGVNFGIGIEMTDKIQIGCAYSWGLIDLYNENYQGIFRVKEPIKHRCWSLSLAVLF